MPRPTGRKKRWKFSAGDLEERKLWDRYMGAYEAALNATSRPWAPWYAIPADDKPYLRRTVAGIVEESLKKLGVDYPSVGEEEKRELQELRDTIV